MRNGIIAAVLATVVVLSVAVVPVAAAELTIDDVSLPSSVTQGDEFDIDVTISGSDVENVETTLSLPDGLSCSPEGTQDVTLTNGEGTASFDCTADAPGDYDGDIDVLVTADRTSDGQSIDDRVQTGIDVLSPASLTLSTSVDDTSIQEGSSTGLTVVVHNTGDASSSYDISVSPGSGLSVGSSSASGTVDGGGIDSTEFTLTGESSGDQTVDVTVTGSDQTLNESKTIEVTASDDGGGTSGGTGGGGGDADETQTEERLIAEETVRSQDARELTDADPDRAGVQVQFETQSVRELSFENEGVAGSGTVDVRESEDVPDSVSRPAGQVRSAVEITVPDDVQDEPATIRVAVSADDIETSPDQVVIERYDADADTWTELETTAVVTEGEELEFEAETPGFSLFAVTETEAPEPTVTETTEEPTEMPTEEPTTEPEPTTEAEQPPTTTAVDQTTVQTTDTETPGFGAVIAVLTVLGTILAAARRRKR